MENLVQVGSLSKIKGRLVLGCIQKSNGEYMAIAAGGLEVHSVGNHLTEVKEIYV